MLITYKVNSYCRFNRCFRTIRGKSEQLWHELINIYNCDEWNHILGIWLAYGHKWYIIYTTTPLCVQNFGHVRSYVWNPSHIAIRCRRKSRFDPFHTGTELSNCDIGELNENILKMYLALPWDITTRLCHDFAHATAAQLAKIVNWFNPAALHFRSFFPYVLKKMPGHLTGRADGRASVGWSVIWVTKRRSTKRRRHKKGRVWCDCGIDWLYWSLLISFQSSIPVVGSRRRARDVTHFQSAVAPFTNMV